MALAVRRTSDVKDVGKPLDFDRAVHAQVGAGAPGQLALQCHLDQHRTVLHVRVDPLHPTLDQVASRIYQCLLARLDLAGLRLGDSELGLESTGLCHSGQGRARLHPLPGLEREVLQHAVGAGRHLHRLHSPTLVLVDRAEPVHLLLLDLQLFVDGLLQETVTLLLGGEPDSCGLGLLPGLQRFVSTDQLAQIEDGVRFRRSISRHEVGACLGQGGFLGQHLGAERAPQIDEAGLCGCPLLLGLKRLQFDVRVAELQEDCPRLHRLARLHVHLLHPPGREGRDESHLLGHEGTGSADGSDHGAALDGADQHGVALDARGRGLHEGEE